MASQTVITELMQGDQIQLYLYTFTGLLDKAGNHFTQFAGMLMRPGKLLRRTQLRSCVNEDIKLIVHSECYYACIIVHWHFDAVTESTAWLIKGEPDST